MNLICCLSSLSCLIYFPSIKFHYVEETHTMSLYLQRKLLQHFSTTDGEKIFCQVFDTDSDMKVHALHYAALCKLATYTRQIFLSKLKLLQTRQTSRKNKKQSKAEIGYDKALS